MLEITVKMLVSEIVKPPSHGIDIYKGQIMVMRAICEQDEDPFAKGIDPQAGTRKARMTKTLARH